MNRKSRATSLDELTGVDSARFFRVLAICILLAISSIDGFVALEGRFADIS